MYQRVMAHNPPHNLHNPPSNKNHIKGFAFIMIWTFRRVHRQGSKQRPRLKGDSFRDKSLMLDEIIII